MALLLATHRCALHHSSPALTLDPCLQGLTGFHMGAMDPSDLLVEDAQALASTVARAARVFPTPQYKDMVVNCISQVRACPHVCVRMHVGLNRWSHRVLSQLLFLSLLWWYASA